MEKEKKGSKVNYRLTDDMKQLLDALAAKMGVSASTLVRFALDDYVQKIEREGFMVRPVRGFAGMGEGGRDPVQPHPLDAMSAAEAEKFHAEAKAEMEAPRTPKEEAESARWDFHHEESELEVAEREEAMDRARVEFELDEQLEGLKISQAERDALLAIRLGAIGTIAAGSPAVSQPVSQKKPLPPTLPAKPASYLPSKKHNPKKK